MRRADRRRADTAAAKAADYALTGFIDKAVYRGFVATPQRPGKDRLTPDQLQARAVERQVLRNARFKIFAKLLSSHELGRAMDDRAPHASRSTAQRKHFDRSKARTEARQAYMIGCFRLRQPIEHMHSAARLRLAA